MPPIVEIAHAFEEACQRENTPFSLFYAPERGTLVGGSTFSAEELGVLVETIFRHTTLKEASILWEIATATLEERVDAESATQPR